MYKTAAFETILINVSSVTWCDLDWNPRPQRIRLQAYRNNLDGIKVDGISFVDVENLLGIPNHSLHVAGQYNLNIKY